MTNTIQSHRLLVSPARWARLRDLPNTPLLQCAAKQLAEMTEPWMRERDIPVDVAGHNWHLIRARHAQTRVLSLLVRYGMTGERGYRDTAMDYLHDIAEWEYWSWITWRDGNADFNAIFDLSYGENATTLAFAYDWLAAELTANEQDFFVETARTRVMQPYLARNGVPGEEMWYYRSPNCNWNTVCNGGAGLLALALGDLLPESARVLELVEEGVRHYFEFMQEDGAWPEGIGYWGYGHRYGYLYLLSHERATGQCHPLLEHPGSKATFRFPFLFSPNGVATGFGDSNHFFALPFIFAGAERYDLPDVAAEISRRMEARIEMSNDCWPDTAELLLFYPDKPVKATDNCPWPRCTILRGLEWGILADRWPTPHLYASIRSGTTDAPHTQQDLTSVWVVVDDEALIVNVTEDDYLDTTFSERRNELYEMSAVSKNMLLVNGVGLPHGAVRTREIHDDNWEGILLDAAEIASVGSPVEHYTRAVLLLEGAALLIIDRIVIHHAGLAEARFHTRSRVQCRAASAHIQGKTASLHLAFAANVPAYLDRSQGLPTHPHRQPDSIIRWRSEAKHSDILLATLMSPEGACRLRLDTRQQIVHARGEGFGVSVRYETTDFANVLT